MNMLLETYLQQCPVIAILRGIKNEECIEIGEALYLAGIRIMEVPLNSPNPFESIRLLAKHFKGRAIIGAGTVLSSEHVIKVKEADGQIIISPNLNLEVGKTAKASGMIWAPGVFTPTEAFLAVEYNADVLKIFPADMSSPALVKAWLATLPKGTRLVPVGGITESNAQQYLDVGAVGLGIGGSIYKPGDTPEKVRNNVDAILSSIG